MLEQILIAKVFNFGGICSNVDNVHLPHALENTLLIPTRGRGVTLGDAGEEAFQTLRLATGEFLVVAAYDAHFSGG